MEEYKLENELYELEKINPGVAFFKGVLWACAISIPLWVLIICGAFALLR